MIREIIAKGSFLRSIFAGIGSCLGIAGGYYLCVDEETTSEQLIEEAWASVGDSLRYAMGSLPKTRRHNDS